ncbi:MAG TPA: c-type cytochrome [Ideonella sp.]|nr:c-type cytochrome [Ideonella sp.]
MRATASLVTLAALGCSAPAAWSAPTAAGVAQQALAATCANCHGTQGKAVDKSEVPGLAGLPAAYLVEQMNAFKSGARPATVMHQIAKGYSPAQIEALAQYFAAQAR